MDEDEDEEEFLDAVDDIITSIEEIKDIYGEKAKAATLKLLDQAIEALNKAQGSL